MEPENPSNESLESINELRKVLNASSLSKESQPSTRLDMKKSSLAARRSQRNASLFSNNPPSITTTPVYEQPNSNLFSSFPSMVTQSPSLAMASDYVKNDLLHSKLPVSNIPVLISKIDPHKPIPTWIKQLSNISPSTLYFQFKTFHVLLNESQNKRLENLESPLGSMSTSGTVYSLKASQLPQNIKRNRYTNILPFDYNRVKLNESHSTQSHPLLLSDHDYINASFIQPFPHEFKNFTHTYISTQGPLPNTFLDFWNMIWNQNVSVIVMLTREEEKLQVKCHTYWPTPQHPSMELHPNLRIELQNETKALNESCILRHFNLISTQFGVKSVCMLQFLEWPDHSASDPQLVLQVIDLAHELQGSETAPMVIHCSAGVGRTGTFCTISTVLKILKQSDMYSTGQDLIQDTIFKLREQRMTMVQSLEQLILCYESVLLALAFL